MAVFEGTPDEFRRYIDPWLRNRIQSRTKSAKRRQGGCADCGKTPVELHAAHLRGRERGVIVQEVLAKNGMVMPDGRLRVNLVDFEHAVMDAHSPLEACFRFLCHSCHRAYDSQATKTG